MKHGDLRSILHNIAHSLASEASMLIGYYDIDVFGEAATNRGGTLVIDVLNGTLVTGHVSPQLATAINTSRDVLLEMLANAGGSPGDLRIAEVQYRSDHLGRSFAITVADGKGRRSTAEYEGDTGRHLKLVDPLGRPRPKTSRL